MSVVSAGVQAGDSTDYKQATSPAKGSEVSGEQPSDAGAAEREARYPKPRAMDAATGLAVATLSAAPLTGSATGTEASADASGSAEKDMSDSSNRGAVPAIDAPKAPAALDEAEEAAARAKREAESLAAEVK